MKATIYVSVAFGIDKIEVNSVSTTRRAWAQYPSAAIITFRRPRERKDRTLIQSNSPSAIILEGWGHPEPIDSFTKPDAAGSSASRYGCYDPRYRTEFDALIDPYIAETGAKVIADFRKLNPHEALATVAPAEPAAAPTE